MRKRKIIFVIACILFLLALTWTILVSNGLLDKTDESIVEFTIKYRGEKYNFVYWFTRIIIWILLAALFPLSCILFGRRIHDIGFNAWAGILWSVIMIFINTYSAVSPFNYLLELFIWLIGFLFWVLPGQPEPNQYGNPPFMPVNRPTYESMQQPKTETEREIRKTVRKRRKKR